MKRKQAARAAVDLRVQLSGQSTLFLVADAILVLWTVFRVLVAGASPEVVYRFSALLPLILLGAAGCSGTFAIERRAGHLELAVSLPRAWSLFLRRACLVTGLLALQGILLILVSWAFEGFSYPIVPVVSQLLVVAVVVAATGLAWSATVRAPSVVLVATLATLLALYPWTFFVPIAPTRMRLPRALLPEARDLPELLTGAAFLLLFAALELAYLRRRLLRPFALMD